MAEQPRTGFPFQEPGGKRTRTTTAGGFPGMAGSPANRLAIDAAPGPSTAAPASPPQSAAAKAAPSFPPLAAPGSLPPSGVAPSAPASPTKVPRKGGDTWWERVRFEVTDAVTSGSLSERLIRASSAVEAPITTGRRVVVLGTAGGAATSTATALLAKLLGSIRQEPVMAVDATDLHGRLLKYLGVEETALLSDLMRQYTAQPVRTLPDAVAAAGSSGSRVFAVGRGDVPAMADAPIGLQEWTDVSATLSRFMAVTIVDGGASPFSRHAAALLGSAHAVVVVSPADADPSRLQELREDLLGSYPDVQQVPVTVHSRQGHGGVLADGVLPFDRHLSAGGTLQLGGLGARTRVAATELAGRALMAANGA
ncbi:hypothetical protein ACIPWF_18975 [Paenarthrobacter sp. NPDC089989]|uniref:hypothetical protein n=1 Tax=unclassified Paenarthrobacter TaxID=2634190 RepID=UPI0037FF6577